MHLSGSPAWAGIPCFARMPAHLPSKAAAAFPDGWGRYPTHAEAQNAGLIQLRVTTAQAVGLYDDSEPQDATAVTA
jgi:hypothetical protein